MRVLFLSPSAGLGGAERMLLAMTRSLQASCPELAVQVLTLDDGPLNDLLEAQGIPVERLPLPPDLAQLGDSQFALGVARHKLGLCWQAAGALRALGPYLGQLRAVVRSMRPSLIHSNGIKTHLLARLAGLDTVPLVWHVHDFYHARPLARRLLRWAAGRLRLAIAISTAVANDVRQVIGGRPVAVVPNAIDLERFQPRPYVADYLDTLAGLPGPSCPVVRVGLVATYARWKGQEVFLQAAAAVREQQPNLAVRFYIIGGPVYRTHGSQLSRAELVALSHRLGLSDRVGFVDFQADASQVYPALDVVVHASTSPEPFGLTIAEAMACGRAVIATQAGGAVELLTPGQDGLGVPPRASAALAAAITQLVCDAALRLRLGVQARASAVRCFDARRLGPQLAGLYQRILRKTGKLRPALVAASPILHTDL